MGTIDFSREKMAKRDKINMDNILGCKGTLGKSYTLKYEHYSMLLCTEYKYRFLKCVCIENTMYTIYMSYQFWMFNPENKSSIVQCFSIYN